MLKWQNIAYFTDFYLTLWPGLSFPVPQKNDHALLYHAYVAMARLHFIFSCSVLHHILLMKFGPLGKKFEKNPWAKKNQK